MDGAAGGIFFSGAHSCAIPVRPALSEGGGVDLPGSAHSRPPAASPSGGEDEGGGGGAKGRHRLKGWETGWALEWGVWREGKCHGSTEQGSRERSHETNDDDNDDLDMMAAAAAGATAAAAGGGGGGGGDGAGGLSIERGGGVDRAPWVDPPTPQTGLC